MRLERYLIADEAMSFKNDMLTTLAAGAILMAPLAVAAIIGRAKRKKEEKLEKARSDEEKARIDRNFRKILEVNDRIKSEYPDLWEKEKKEREKAIEFFKKQTKFLESKNKKLLNGLKFGPTWRDPDDDYDESDDFSSFLTDPIPKDYPEKSGYWYCGGWSAGEIISYSIWDWSMDHEDVNVRNPEECEEFWKALNDMVKIADGTMKSNRFFYKIDCGGDWDDGSYYIAIKPSDEILKVAYSMGVKKWPNK